MLFAISNLFLASLGLPPLDKPFVVCRQLQLDQLRLDTVIPQ
jgi:hypothetical protein